MSVLPKSVQCSNLMRSSSGNAIAQRRCPSTTLAGAELAISSTKPAQAGGTVMQAGNPGIAGKEAVKAGNQPHVERMFESVQVFL